jgi:hypothetical protein
MTTSTRVGQAENCAARPVEPDYPAKTSSISMRYPILFAPLDPVAGLALCP